MSTAEPTPTPTPEMTPTGRMPNLEAQLITQAIQDPAFRQRLMENPKAVLAEQGLNVPDDVQINVLQESPTQYYLVLPALELLTTSGEVAELSDAELEAVAGGINVDSQNSNWTGCASGRSGCVATNGCSIAAAVTVAVGSAIATGAIVVGGTVATSGFGLGAAVVGGSVVATACAGAAGGTALSK